MEASSCCHTCMQSVTALAAQRLTAAEAGNTGAYVEVDAYHVIMSPTGSNCENGCQRHFGGCMPTFDTSISG